MSLSKALDNTSPRLRNRPTQDVLPHASMYWQKMDQAWELFAKQGLALLQLGRPTTPRWPARFIIQIRQLWIIKEPGLTKLLRLKILEARFGESSPQARNPKLLEPAGG